VHLLLVARPPPLPHTPLDAPRGLKIPVRVEPMLRGGIPPCFDTERKQQRRAAAYPADQ